MRIVLGVSGGIAAYKSVFLLRLLKEAGHEVTVVPTDAALKFVGAPTWEALSGAGVQTDVWSNITEVPHVRIGQEADLVIVAPATADLLAKAAAGLAGDLLTNVLLTARCPVVMAPAMHTEMWEHPATQANVATLRERGVTIIDPDSGRLTGADTGPGRLPEPQVIAEKALALVGASIEPAGGADAGATTGPNVLITAGGTREAIDPVRFLGNHSSGKQGIALAVAAANSGAKVNLILGSIDVPAPEHPRISVTRVSDTRSMQQAVTEQAAQADVVIMAAAVADFRPAKVAQHKIKKSYEAGAEQAPTIELVRNPDILAELVAARKGSSPLIVGFAAETGDAKNDPIELGRAKLARKKCDLLAVNEVGENLTFGQDETTLHLLSAGQDDAVTLGPASKADVSAKLWKLINARLPKS